jgi:hypothetical protein
MEKLLDLSPDEKAILARIRTVKGKFSEMLVQSTETRGIARLVPDPLSYWISTTDPKDNLKLEALRRKHGDLRAALLEAANGMNSIDTILRVRGTQARGVALVGLLRASGCP